MTQLDLPGNNILGAECHRRGNGNWNDSISRFY
jgi:hypothetical protein